MESLRVKETIGDCVVGTVTLGPRHSQVEVGKMAPLLRKAEDPEGLARAGFLDPTVPTELNLVSAQLIRGRLATLALAGAGHPDWLPADRMLKRRPSIGYVAPEVMTNPTHLAVNALCRTDGSVSNQVGGLWFQETDGLNRARGILRAIPKRAASWSDLHDVVLRSDGDFLVELAKQKIYFAWLAELIATADFMGVELIAPPVAVVTKDLQTSPQRQVDMNEAARVLWRKAAGLRTTGLLYSLHIHPSALEELRLLEAALQGFARSVQPADNPYYGVHIHFVDVGLALRNGDRVRNAREFVREACAIARRSAMFSWVSDVGPLGPVFLDRGASFTSYHPGMTMRRAYTVAGADEEDDTASYGKVLGLHSYEFMDREQLRRRNWRVEQTGLFPNEVPFELRAERAYKPYRVGFGKPTNVAVAEWLNVARAREIQVRRDGRCGTAHVGKSADSRIAAWAAL